MKTDSRNSRYKQKRHSIVSQDLFDKFKKQYPEYDITFKEFKEIVERFNKSLTKKIAEDRYGYEFPRGLGFSIVLSVRKNGRMLNFKQKREDGSYMCYNNNDTNGMICKIMYSNYESKYNIKDKSIWNFKPSQKFQRYTSKVYKDNYTKYMYIDKRTRLVGFIRNTERNREVKPIEANNYLLYDEFNF